MAAGYEVEVGDHVVGGDDDVGHEEHWKVRQVEVGIWSSACLARRAFHCYFP